MTTLKNQNVKAQMPNQIKNPNDKKYDLMERTARFGEAIIAYAQLAKHTSQPTAYKSNCTVRDKHWSKLHGSGLCRIKKGLST